MSESDVKHAPPPNLVKIDVANLLERFNHQIRFPADWEFVILHGPNGVGKTKILELIRALLTNNLKALSAIPFSGATLDFEDGRRISVTREEEVVLLETQLRSTRARGAGVARKEPAKSINMVIRHYNLKFRDRDGSVYEWETEGTPKKTKDIIVHLAGLAPVARSPQGYWRDMSGSGGNNDVMDDDELFDKYSGMLSVSNKPRMAAPPLYLEFLDSVGVYLIETQRLLASQKRRVPGTLRRPMTSRVLENSDDLSRKIRMALTVNSTVSSRLEKTFPNRLFSAGADERLVPDEAEIRERYKEQMRIRNELEQIAVLDTSADLPLPERVLKDWERAVLWTYLEDAEEKLSAFRSILARVTVFRDITLSRFKYKQIKFSQERGFVFVTGDDTEISPDKLSSGEQHQLVLLYDLIFNVRPGTLVMIDEPEISLHVAWQQSFLADITRIAHLNSLRFIIATHSPQVIHKWWSRAVALAPDEEDVNGE